MENSQEQENEIAQEKIIEQDKKTKYLFCKRCGGKIDSGKKCTKCGKQYFKVTFNFILTLILSLIILILGIILFFQVKKVFDLESKLQTAINEKNTIASELTNYQNKYYDALYDNISKEGFMDDHVVIVCNDGTKKYHKYGCKDLNLSSFWVYNTEAAIDKGYVMCKKCN